MAGRNLNILYLGDISHNKRKALSGCYDSLFIIINGANSFEYCLSTHDINSNNDIQGRRRNPLKSISSGCPRIVVRGRLLKSGMTILFRGD
jgi:hypothetical protein